MLTYKPNIVLSNKEYNVVGTRPIRHDGAEKVTGRAAYGADVGALILPCYTPPHNRRSPHHQAKLGANPTRCRHCKRGAGALSTTPVCSKYLVALHHGMLVRHCALHAWDGAGAWHRSASQETWS